MFRELHKSHDVCEILHESFVEDPQTTYNNLFKFLDLPETEVTWMKSKKVMPNPEEYILNYQQSYSLMKSLDKQLKNNQVSTFTYKIVPLISRAIDKLKRILN